MAKPDLGYIAENLRGLATPVGELHADPANARTGHDVRRIAASLKAYGQRKPLVANRAQGGKVEAGNGTLAAALSLGWTHVAVVWVDDDPATAAAFGIADNRTGELSRWDAEALGALADVTEGLFTAFTGDELAEVLGVKPAGTADAEAQVDRAEELRQKWGVEPGDLWRVGEHRLICGDCTDAAVVARVMGGEKAVVCHADPPYGMGKEAEGIANDNLYRERLDTFQMQWWKACRPSIEDNGSVYIWGTAEDLWRLWYMGGLKNSERLTLRNEIVWNKGSAQGMNSDQHRMYPTASERALFFMLGEQGFNNNADNYWDGWEPIRAYLKEQRDLMGWDNAKCKTLAGHSPSSGCHWFDASQWIFVTKDAYTAWQAAAKGAGFKREHDDLKRDYDELKRDFYATRAYFDNAHASMTDVWDFPGVTGDERHGHATPKPVAMMARAIKSSSPDGAIVYAPFNGTGPELIACENLGRRCRAVEISPGYVAVALERMATAFPGIVIERVGDG